MKILFKSIRYPLIPFIVLVTAMLSMASSISADESPPRKIQIPDTNETVSQNFLPPPALHKASPALEIEVLSIAQNSLGFFLQMISKKDPEKFGFTDKKDFSEASIGTQPVQMYTRYNGSDYPTDVWRVPVQIRGKTCCFLTVSWINDRWQTVEVGGAKMATLLSQMEQIAKPKSYFPDQGQLHRFIVRDYQNRVDSVQTETYHREKTTLKTLQNYPQIIQEQNQWCWAGVTASLFEYFNTPTEQCQIANYTRTVASWHDFGDLNCCESPDGDCNYWNYNWGVSGSIKDILESMYEGVTIANYGVSSKLSLAQIETDLAEDLPFVIRWQWAGGGGHFVVGYHIENNPSDATNPLLYYMNPWDGEGNTISYYDWVSLGGNHTWSHTNRLTAVTLPGDIDGNKHLELEDLLLSLLIVTNKVVQQPKTTADVNGDNQIGLAETLYLLKNLSR